mmetsp:Transcript_17674/g.24929  ORF Transcript_17674/g.24929 Transcript_17674/m.24929 type:complete len:263 (+) Transcript_17674:43-831(+)
MGNCLEKDSTTDKVTETLNAAFPGSLTGKSLASSVQKCLSAQGYKNETTLLAMSLCCDEVNRELESYFKEIYAENFSMGGLAGFPFGGVTSFGAMAHHIPEDGSCLVVYGPHVGIDLDGTVGKVNRRGRAISGACCGSATAAAAYVKGVSGGKIAPAAFPSDPLDAQQYFVGNMLLPHSSRLESASEVAVELPLSLFDAQNDFMKKIVDKACGEVHGDDAKIALLGGIQINTPEGYPEYFLPKVFEIYNNKGDKISDLLPSL